jgi:hypothetical protein
MEQFNFGLSSRPNYGQDRNMEAAPYLTMACLENPLGLWFMFES